MWEGWNLHELAGKRGKNPGKKPGVGNGNRTRNRRSHSPVLCQLSYSHRHADYSNCVPGVRSHVRLHTGWFGECYASMVGGAARHLPFFRAIFFRITILSCGFFLINASRADAAAWSVHAQPARPVNGSPIFFQAKPPYPLQSLSASWIGHNISFSFDAKSKTWYALAGISLETTPGTYPLTLTAVRVSGKESTNEITFVKNFAIGRGKYPKIKVTLNVESKFTEPNPEQVKQIEEGQQIKKDYLNRVTPDREWDGQFIAPASAAISDVFASERIFNGKTSSPHLGLDFRVPGGTPVEAMNDGTVLLARPLFFEGNFVVIDHGQGLLTLYLHLSEFKVKEGDQVKRGQIIGLSGGTGRATGPHLHVAVRWQGTYLDPAQLIKLRLP
jgi:murein DD-endopeptidase MepM/ murein hydrolase activator NlpD